MQLIHKKKYIEKIQSTITPPFMFPLFEKLSSIYFPKRLELLLYTVFALPNASKIGLNIKNKMSEAWFTQRFKCVLKVF